MSTESFRRHTRRVVDAATRRVLSSLSSSPEARDACARLLLVAHARSDLMRTPPQRDGTLVQLDAIRNLAGFHPAFVRDVESWTGATGHRLQVIDSFARHLLAPYPTPRFLASVWFGRDTDAGRSRRHLFIAHARGRRFRSLPMPYVMTRRMEDIFLRSPDHLGLEHALRRAEVLGLGGSAALAGAVIATRLGEDLDHGDFWRTAIEWLVHRGDDLALAQVGPIVDYLHAMRAAQPALSLKGRTVASMLRAVAAWHAELARQATARLSWPRSSWRELRYEERTDDRVEWSVVELLDSRQLAAEGRAMHHCVATYAAWCVARRASIWSLRRRILTDDDHTAAAPRSILTIEICPRSARIVQVRGVANQPPTGRPLEVLRLWAARERLSFLPTAVV